MSDPETPTQRIARFEAAAQRCREVGANYCASQLEAVVKRLRQDLDELHPERLDAPTGARRLRETARVSGEPVESRSKRGP